MKQITEKQKYQKPLIEVIEVENEGVMAASVSDVGHGGNIFQSTSSGAARKGTKYQNQNPLQELEDMINDFLTY